MSSCGVCHWAQLRSIIVSFFFLSVCVYVYTATGQLPRSIQPRLWRYISLSLFLSLPPSLPPPLSLSFSLSPLPPFFPNLFIKQGCIILFCLLPVPSTWESSSHAEHVPTSKQRSQSSPLQLLWSVLEPDTLSYYFCLQHNRLIRYCCFCLWWTIIDIHFIIL